MKLYKIVQKLFLIIFLVIFVGGILTNQSQIMRVNTVWMLLGTLFFIVALVLLYRTYSKAIEKIKISKKNEIVSVVSISIIFILILSVISYYLQANAQGGYEWDLRIVIDYVYSLANKISPAQESLDYLKSYSNCNGAILLLFPIYKIFSLIGVESTLLPGIIFNIICIYVSLLCIYFIVKKLYNTKKALFMFSSSILLTPIFLYAPIFYTDTLSMPFVMLQVLIWLYNKDKITKSFVFFPIVAAVGFIIKPTTIFITIAIALDMFIKNWKNIKYIIVSVVVLLVVLLGYSFITSKVFKTMGENKMPFTHFIMMGMYERPKASYEEGTPGISVRGAFTATDVIHTNFGTLELENLWDDYPHYSLLALSEVSYEDKIALDMAMIEYRVSQFNIFTYTKFLYNKTIQTWADGNFYVSAKLNRGYIYKNMFGEVFRVDGKYFEVYYYISHFIWMAIMFLIVVGCYSDIKNKDNNKSFIKVALLLLFVFLLFWETRSRYLLNYLPLLYILAISGYEKVKEFLK